MIPWWRAADDTPTDTVVSPRDASTLLILGLFGHRLVLPDAREDARNRAKKEKKKNWRGLGSDGAWTFCHFRQQLDIHRGKARTALGPACESDRYLTAHFFNKVTFSLLPLILGYFRL